MDLEELHYLSDISTPKMSSDKTISGIFSALSVIINEAKQMDDGYSRMMKERVCAGWSWCMPRPRRRRNRRRRCSRRRSCCWERPTRRCAGERPRPGWPQTRLIAGGCRAREDADRLVLDTQTKAREEAESRGKAAAEAAMRVAEEAAER